MDFDQALYIVIPLPTKLWRGYSNATVCPSVTFLALIMHKIYNAENSNLRDHLTIQNSIQQIYILTIFNFTTEN
jgi:hypothetical protein